MPEKETKKMEHPIVSIVMGVYNCQRYISECMESIINQTFKDWEFIICDDGSSDCSYKILENYKIRYPEKIKLLKNKNNLGLNQTLNNCISIAKGKYIARQDADDVSKLDRLQKQVDFLEANPAYSIVSANMLMFDDKSVWGQTSYCGEVEKKTLY